MSTKKAVFDWSILDRKGLTNLLWMVHPELVDTKLTVAKFQSIVSTHIKKYLPVRVSKKLDTDVESTWVYVGGMYYSDYDEDRKKCIEVIFAYNSSDKYITITDTKYKRMCKTFADVLLHELMHMRQYRRRQHKALPDYESKAEMSELRQEQSYLGCTDEIDAYSFNIACELLDKFKGNDTEAVAYISKKHRKGRMYSHSLRAYLRAFEYDHNHPIIKRLKKRIIRYLPNAQLGKPYRTADWINR